MNGRLHWCPLYPNLLDLFRLLGNGLNRSRNLHHILVLTCHHDTHLSPDEDLYQGLKQVGAYLHYYAYVSYCGFVTMDQMLNIFLYALCFLHLLHLVYKKYLGFNHHFSSFVPIKSQIFCYDFLDNIFLFTHQ